MTGVAGRSRHAAAGRAARPRAPHRPPRLRRPGRDHPLPARAAPRAPGDVTRPRRCPRQDRPRRLRRPCGARRAGARHAAGPSVPRGVRGRAGRVLGRRPRRGLAQLLRANRCGDSPRRPRRRAADVHLVGRAVRVLHDTRPDDLPSTGAGARDAQAEIASTLRAGEHIGVLLPDVGIRLPRDRRRDRRRARPHAHRGADVHARRPQVRQRARFDRRACACSTSTGAARPTRPSTSRSSSPTCAGGAGADERSREHPDRRASGPDTARATRRAGTGRRRSPGCSSSSSPPAGAPCTTRRGSPDVRARVAAAAPVLAAGCVMGSITLDAATATRWPTLDPSLAALPQALTDLLAPELMAPARRPLDTRSTACRLAYIDDSIGTTEFFACRGQRRRVGPLRLARRHRAAGAHGRGRPGRGGPPPRDPCSESRSSAPSSRCATGPGRAASCATTSSARPARRRSSPRRCNPTPTRGSPRSTPSPPSARQQSGLVAEMVAWWPDLHVVVGRSVDGRSASSVLSDPDVPADAKVRLGHDLGDLLARFHALPVEPDVDVVGRSAGHHPGRRDGRRRVRRPGHRDPAGRRPRHPRRHDARARRPVLGHGSFRAGQVVVTPDGRPVLLDVDEVRHSDRERDLGVALAHMTWQGIRHPDQQKDLDQAERALLAAYEDAAGEVRPDALRWWRAAGLVQVAVRRFRRLEVSAWSMTDDAGRGRREPARRQLASQRHRRRPARPSVRRRRCSGEPPVARSRSTRPSCSAWRGDGAASSGTRCAGSTTTSGAVPVIGKQFAHARLGAPVLLPPAPARRRAVRWRVVPRAEPGRPRRRAPAAVLPGRRRRTARTRCSTGRRRRGRAERGAVAGPAARVGAAAAARRSPWPARSRAPGSGPLEISQEHPRGSRPRPTCWRPGGRQRRNRPRSTPSTPSCRSTRTSTPATCCGRAHLRHRPRRGADGRPRVRRRALLHLPRRSSEPGLAPGRVVPRRVLGGQRLGRQGQPRAVPRLHLPEDREAGRGSAAARSATSAKSVAWRSPTPPWLGARLGRHPLAGVVMMNGRVVYIVRSWPRLSQTFIVNEVLALERRGVQLDVVSLVRSGETVVQPQVADVRARSRTWTSHGLAGSAPTCPRSPRPPAATCPRCCSACGAPSLAAGYGDCSALECLTHAVRIAAGINALRGADRPTHVHAHFAHDPALVGMLVAMLTGLPFSFTGHARDLYQIPARSLAARAARATTLVTCCEANVTYIRETLPRRADPGGGHPPRRRPRPVRPAGPPATDGVPALVSVGRLVEKKGVRRPAPRAGQHRRSRSPCRIYGDGPLHDELVPAARRARPRGAGRVHGRARQRRDRRGPRRRRRVRPHPHQHRGRRPRRHPQRPRRGDGVRPAGRHDDRGRHHRARRRTTSTACSATRRTSPRSPRPIGARRRRPRASRPVWAPPAARTVEADYDVNVAAARLETIYSPARSARAPRWR